MSYISYLNFVVLFLGLVVFSSASWALETAAKHAIVVDYETGTVLYEKEANTPMPTSSMSKVMTVYAAFEALKAGKVRMEDTMPVSEKAWRMQGSKMFVDLGSNIQVSDLLRGVIVQSGNDATIVLAEGLAGSEEAFARAMNSTAKRLGMENTNLVNASGWPDPEHYSTARDLSILARALIQNFPEYYPIYAEKEFTYNSIKQGNRNPLLYRNIGADGIKTGHTEDAGYGLIGTGVENGRRVIIVMNGLSSQQERADESAKLLLWGLRSFENKKLVTANASLETANVMYGTKRKANLVSPVDITMTVPKMQDHKIKLEIRYKSPLIAPLKAGQDIGTLMLYPSAGEPVLYPLVVGEDVPELDFFPKILAKFNYMIGLR